MAISGGYINKPGTLDRARAKITGKKVYFVFHVSTRDIEQELKKFNVALSKDLIKEMKSSNPGKSIQRRASLDLKIGARKSSPRIQRLLSSMKENMIYKPFDGKATKTSGTAKNIRMQVFDSVKMDAMTNIATLDKLYPETHIAPFAQEKNPLKKLSSLATKHRRQKKFSLWRMYEYETKPAYPIPTVAKGPLVFTSAKDGYSKWHISRRVKWSTSGAVGGVANWAYYLLNSSRTMYKTDKKVFSKTVGKGIQKIIQTKTRFH